MEAALQDRGVLLSDRYRLDPLTGRPLLTLRRLRSLVWKHPREDSPVLATKSGSMPWTRLEHLVDDLRRTQLATHGVKNPKVHPGRVEKRAKPVDPKRAAMAKRRAARRRQELEEMGDR